MNADEVIDQDQQFLRRAMRLAMKGRGRVEPNPMVGCVIVKDGRVIGEGFHGEFGGPHAEPAALASCSESPAGATAYVTLEPCSHTSKKTPPCTPRLIEAKLARIVVGCLDPNPQVDGKGIEMLRAAGIEVDAPMLKDASRQLIAPFIARQHFRWPYVTMKWAQTADGKVAGPRGNRLWISNDTATAAVHQLRARCDAIMVGIGTVLADDPMLTARRVQHSRLSSRIVLDSSLRIPLESRLVRSARDGYVDVYCTVRGLADAPKEKVKQLLEAGVHIHTRDEDLDRRVRLPDVLREGGVFDDVTHLLIEPGPTLAKSCFEANLADRLWVIRSPRRVDDDTAPAAAAIPQWFAKTGEFEFDGDVLSEYLNTESRVFFAAEPSADLALART